MRKSAISFDNVLARYAHTPVLVLGASGFIGRWVARYLTQAGAELYLPARDCAAAKNVFSEYRIKGNIFKVDLRDFDLLGRLIAEIKPAITLNLVGYGVDRSETSADLADRINRELPEIVCSAVANTTPDQFWNGQRFVHAGTAMEYGAVAGDLREDSSTRPTTLYGSSKLAGTQAVTSVCRAQNLDGITARLFAVYGPGEAPERLLPTLIAESRTTSAIKLTAGLHKRDFTYIEDVAEALLRLGVSTKCRPGQVVNVATGNLSTIRSFVESAADRMGIAGSRLSFGALETRSEEMEHDPVNLDRLIELTGWSPEVTIADGIRRTLSFGHEVTEISAARSQRRATYEAV